MSKRGHKVFTKTKNFLDPNDKTTMNNELKYNSNNKPYK